MTRRHISIAIFALTLAAILVVMSAILLSTKPATAWTATVMHTLSGIVTP